MSPPPIYLKPPSYLKAEGSGYAENRRIEIAQVVKVAPKNVRGRKAVLVLTTGEAFSLGIDLMGTIPINFVVGCKDAEEKASRVKQLTKVKEFYEALTAGGNW